MMEKTVSSIDEFEAQAEEMGKKNGKTTHKVEKKIAIPKVVVPKVEKIEPKVEVQKVEEQPQLTQEDYDEMFSDMMGTKKGKKGGKRAKGERKAPKERPLKMLEHPSVKQDIEAYKVALAKGEVVHIIGGCFRKVWGQGYKDKTARADMAFTGSMFKQAMTAMGAVKDARYFITTPKHGIMMPQAQIENFEMDWGDAGQKPLEEFKKQWAAFGLNDAAVIMLWAGGEVPELINQLKAPTQKVIAPAEGLPIGKALGALKVYRVATEHITGSRAVGSEKAPA